MPAPVHQLVHTLSYGDAISGEVLALQRCLRESGHESEIYCIHTHPKYVGQTRLFSELPQDFSGQVILHYSLGSPLNALYRTLGKARRALIHHNLTPARWFKTVNPRVARDIEHGMAELPELCRLSDLLIADSEYNAQELQEFASKTRVLELPLDPQKWNIPRNEGLFQLVKQEGGVHLLHVGRLAPNKCIEDIIKIFYFYHCRLNPQSRLWLVGIDTDTELYSFALKRMVSDLSLDGRVNFTGCLADSEVKALYEACDVYLCMSEHEGFCMPLVEAMSFQLPIIAYASTAIPKTLADGGVLVSQKRHGEIAALAEELRLDQPLKQRLREAAKKRTSSLTYGKFCKEVREIFSDS